MLACIFVRACVSVCVQCVECEEDFISDKNDSLLTKITT